MTAFRGGPDLVGHAREEVALRARCRLGLCEGVGQLDVPLLGEAQAALAVHDEDQEQRDAGGHQDGDGQDGHPVLVDRLEGVDGVGALLDLLGLKRETRLLRNPVEDILVDADELAGARVDVGHGQPVRDLSHLDRPARLDVVGLVAREGGRGIGGVPGAEEGREEGGVLHLRLGKLGVELREAGVVRAHRGVARRLLEAGDHLEVVLQVHDVGHDGVDPPRIKRRTTFVEGVAAHDVGVVYPHAGEVGGHVRVVHLVALHGDRDGWEGLGVVEEEVVVRGERHDRLVGLQDALRRVGQVGRGVDGWRVRHAQVRVAVGHRLLRLRPRVERDVVEAQVGPLAQLGEQVDPIAASRVLGVVLEEAVEGAEGDPYDACVGTFAGSDGRAGERDERQPDRKADCDG